MNQTIPYVLAAGMINRGPNVDSPFRLIVDAQIYKNSLSSRNGWQFLGVPPRDYKIFEMVELKDTGEVYEIVVDGSNHLYLFLNGNLILDKQLHAYTGGPLKTALLGNVIGIWDPATTVTMAVPAANPYPYEGFIVVHHTVDYNTTIKINSPAGQIVVTIPDPIAAGYGIADGLRNVEAVAKAIATGIGGGGAWQNAGQVALAAQAEAQAYWDSLVEEKDPNTAEWATLPVLAANYYAAEAAYLALDTRTLAQRTMEHDYWLALIPGEVTKINAVDVSSNPTYTLGMDYTIRANANTLTASPEKTLILGYITNIETFTANAAAALIAPDNTAVTNAYIAAIQAIYDDLVRKNNNWWAGYIYHGDGFAMKLQQMMGKYATAVAVFLNNPATRAYAYKGNVVYIPDIRNFSVVEGNDYLRIIQGKVSNTTELPRFAPAGTILRIEPIPNIGPATYSKAAPKQNLTSGNFLTEVVWPQCANEDEAYAWNQNTLPCFLDLKPLNVWNTPTSLVPYWTEKKAGDITLCPNPLIVNSKITDMGRGANRLFLLGENATLTISELGKRQNLFRTSSLEVYPTDPITGTPAGEYPSHYHTIAHWGKNIALLGTSNLQMLDLTAGLDATFPKMTRVSGWSGTRAYPISTEATLILVGEEVLVLDAGAYGNKAELFSKSDRINLPQNLIKGVYDTNRHTLYLLYSDCIYVGKFGGELVGWVKYSIPGEGLNMWLETNYLRLEARIPSGESYKYGIFRILAHPWLEITDYTFTQQTDEARWGGRWSPVDLIGAPTVDLPSTGARPDLILDDNLEDATYTVLKPLLRLRGTHIKSPNRVRMARGKLETQGDTIIECTIKGIDLSFTTNSVRATAGHVSNSLEIPIEMSGNIMDTDWFLAAGELSGLYITYNTGNRGIKYGS